MRSRREAGAQRVRLHHASATVLVFVVVIAPVSVAMTVAIVAITVVVSIGTVIPGNDASGNAGSQQRQEGAQGG